MPIPIRISHLPDDCVYEKSPAGKRGVEVRRVDHRSRYRGHAVSLVLYFTPPKWFEMRTAASDFGLNFGFVLLGTALFMLITLLFPEGWGQTVIPRIVVILGASLFLGGLAWQFLGTNTEPARAQSPATPGCSNSVGGNNSGPLTNNCTFNLGQQRLQFSDDLGQKLLNSMPDHKKMVTIQSLGGAADQAERTGRSANRVCGLPFARSMRTSE